MRKLLILLLVFPLLVACANKDTGKDIIAIDFPSFDAVRVVMGGDDNVSMLLPPGSESHHYEPTPKDMIALSNAKLVVYAGGESDAWVDTILSSLDKNVQTFKLIDQVKLYKEEKKEGMTVDEKEEDEDEIDEHVWTSPINEIEIVENLARTLIDIYPEKKSELQSNCDSFVKDLKTLDEDFRSVVASSKYKTLVFGSRFPLRYFVEEYGLDYYAAFPGCAEETEPSAKTIAFLIGKIKELGIGYVLDIEFGSPLVASTIASESGAKVRTFNSMHNLTSDSFRAGDNYITIMRKNLEVLKEVLN